MRINKLTTKGCSIYLHEAESKMISEKINHLVETKRLNVSSISAVLYLLYENTDLRYFNIDDINMISKNLYSLINEEVGRNLQSDEAEPITAEKLNNPEEERVDPENGNLVISKAGKVKRFKDEAETSVFYHNIRKKS